MNRKITKLETKKPLNFLDTKINFLGRLSALVEKIEIKVEEYLFQPVNPTRSLNIFLLRLDFDIGKGADNMKSGSCLVSVNLWCFKW